MLEWDQLRFMLAIHRGGSMQAAAEALRVDRATVLRRLDALETALGARVFERRRDGCTLTRAGLDIIGTVKGIEQAAVALAARVGGEDKRAEGVVTVTVPEFFAVKVLVPALPRLRAAHPGITVAISSGHGFLNLARGEADIALRNRRPDHQSLVARRVGTVGIGLFAARSYLERRGAPVGDFTGHDMVLFDETLAGMPGIARVEAEAQRARVAMRSNEIIPVLTAVRAGLGIGTIPAVAAHGEPDLVPVAPGIVGQPEIYLVTHSDLRHRARVRAVFDFIARICTENAAALSGKPVVELFADRAIPE
jgi:DNA-binding transcriptional LysR family regulator